MAPAQNTIECWRVDLDQADDHVAALTGVLHFSVSHSQDLAVIALARHAPLGVDVEALRPLPNAADLACRYFTAAEADTIATAPAAERLLTFFLCWTRKEAFAKARGDGLARARRRAVAMHAPPRPLTLARLDVHAEVLPRLRR